MLTRLKDVIDIAGFTQVGEVNRAESWFLKNLTLIFKSWNFILKKS